MSDVGLPAVLAIFGPTASGKSAVAAAVAERVPAALVSADAMQVYRGLPLLTNQSDPPERLVGQRRGTRRLEERAGERHVGEDAPSARRAGCPKTGIRRLAGQHELARAFADLFAEDEDRGTPVGEEDVAGHRVIVVLGDRPALSADVLADQCPLSVGGDL